MVEFVTTVAETFVRVHASNNMVNPWVLRESDISGYSASEIASTYNIAEVPTQLSRVYIPAGTPIRVGLLAPSGSNSGAVQYEIRMPGGQAIPKEWFTKIKDI